MKKMLTLIALVAASLALNSCHSSAEKGTAVASSATASPTAGAAESSADVEKSLAQMEREGMEAYQKKDTAAMERILADDFMLVDGDGKTINKATAIAEVKSGEYKIESFTLDPVKVRVFGDVAVATTGDTEKSTYKGKDSSGRYVWMSVYAKRNGRWQAVATQVARVQQPKA
jgi:uncharacterized protein (TIGR02246 family)